MNKIKGFQTDHRDNISRVWQNKNKKYIYVYNKINNLIKYKNTSITI